MRRAVRIRPAGEWPANDADGTVTLEFDARHRRRIRLRDDAGVAFLLELDRATQLADGDGLEFSDGGILRVVAAPEAVLDVRAADQQHLARLAWHIGNRHIPLQVLADGILRLRHDHVLAQMLEGLGAQLSQRRAPFNPETGAYAGHGHAPSASSEAAPQHTPSPPSANPQTNKVSHG